ncbi:hypothetical protein BSL78_20286 [Apostichopus japonicus]|uniref:Sulfotransferase family protein n=1 Tax=Stichopus japonicus TaxID=307972 RepID=A0A2G8K4E1_STIJA|nr:hypothetical protein BSL78_20286 [Apostichopus japonicus]
MATAQSKEGHSQIRVALWAPPRSLSTAFERCISTLHAKHALTIFHEPFTAAYHLGPEKQLRYPVPFTQLITKDRKYTYSWVQRQLEADFHEKDIIFFKDLGYSIDGKYDHLPSGYQHTFLLRNPEQVFTSMNNLLLKYPIRLVRLKVKSIIPKRFIYEEMFDLYEHLTKELGQKVIIIDSEDLVENPKAMLELYCKETGIPFYEDMVNWRTGQEDMKDWKYSKKLMRINRVIGQYDRAMSTSGLGKPSPRTFDVEKYPRDCRDAITHSEPFYNKLYEKRLRLSDQHNPNHTEPL